MYLVPYFNSEKGAVAVNQSNKPVQRYQAVKSHQFSYRKNWSAIKYLIPVYGTHGGNHTLIGLEGQPDYEDPRRLKTVLSRLGQVFSLDLVILRKQCAELVKRTNNVPLGLNQNLVLIPVHIRTPLTKDDGATGQVVLNKIKSIKPQAAATGKRGSRIVFNDGTWLDVQQQAHSLYKLEGEAVMVKKAVAELHAYPTVPNLPDHLAEATAGYQGQTQSQIPQLTLTDLIAQLNLTEPQSVMDQPKIDELNKLFAYLFQQGTWLTLLQLLALSQTNQTQDNQI